MSQATDRDDLDVEALRQRLEERRQELVAQGESSAEHRRTVELDQQQQGRLSRIDALQNQAMAEAAERRRKAEIQRIDAALERMAEGEYGYCVATGEPVEKARLENDPSVPTCLAYAKGKERS